MTATTATLARSARVVRPVATLHGEVDVPGDKSITHRAVMLNAIAQGTATVRGAGLGADCLSTAACMRALGATGTRIASALLAESAWIGIAGGIFGVALAWNAVRLVVASGSRHLPRIHEIRLDPVVLIAALLLSVGAAVVLGLLPLLQQPRDGSSSIARIGRGDIGGRDRQRVRRGLIVAQLALALVLLTGSGLMLRSFAALYRLDNVVETKNMTTMAIRLPDAKYPAAREWNAFFRELEERLSGIPAISAATTSRSASG